MWNYEKRLQYPVKIARPNPKMAKMIMSQMGGPDGELAASLRYLSQRYAMPFKEGKAILTDIGTEELAHLEIISAIIHQLTRTCGTDELDQGGMLEYYVDHTNGQWPQAAGGVPFSATVFQSKGDPITDLHEDMAAEQKARTTYDNLLRIVDDPDVKDALRFLREREIVHYQRFGEALRIVQERLDCRNYYAINPAFDHKQTALGKNGNTGAVIYAEDVYDEESAYRVNHTCRINDVCRTNEASRASDVCRANEASRNAVCHANDGCRADESINESGACPCKDDSCHIGVRK